MLHDFTNIWHIKYYSVSISMRTGNLKEILIIGLLPEVPERCYQVNIIYQIRLI